MSIVSMSPSLECGGRLTSKLAHLLAKENMGLHGLIVYRSLIEVLQYNTITSGFPIRRR